MKKKTPCKTCGTKRTTKARGIEYYRVMWLCNKCFDKIKKQKDEKRKKLSNL